MTNRDNRSRSLFTRAFSLFLLAATSLWGGTLGERAYTQYWEGNIAASLGNYARALKQARRVDDPAAMAKYGLNLAHVYLQAGDMARAREHLKTALHLYRDRKDNVGTALCLVLEGKCLTREGNAARALQEFSRAASLFEREKDSRGVTLCRNEKAMALLAQGNVSQARTELQAVLEQNRKRKNYKGVASNHSNLGRISLQENQLAQARDHFLQALQFDEKSGSPTGKSVPLLYLSQISALQGKCDEAGEYYRRARSLTQGPPDPAAVETIHNSCPGILD